MATKNIKKILLNKNGNNFVADIEDIENRITQNNSNLETAKQELSNKCNEALSAANNANAAANNANAAANNANNNANNRVHLTSAQTITAQHNFSNGVNISGYLITIG